jgi:hypothetical protein
MSQQKDNSKIPQLSKDHQEAIEHLAMLFNTKSMEVVAKESKKLLLLLRNRISTIKRQNIVSTD